MTARPCSWRIPWRAARTSITPTSPTPCARIPPRGFATSTTGESLSSRARTALSTYTPRAVTRGTAAFTRSGTGAWRWRGRCAKNWTPTPPGFWKTSWPWIYSWMRGCAGASSAFIREAARFTPYPPQPPYWPRAGAGQIYSENTNAGGITGDGFGVALRAGLAPLRYGVRPVLPGRHQAPREQYGGGAHAVPLGARFLNRDGVDVLRDVPGGGGATRDLMARAVYLELMQGGGVDGAVQMDLSGISMADLEHFAPDNLKLFARRGVSPHGGDIYVSPKAHFFMGGVPIDGNGATAMPGLYAAGEVSAGAHGRTASRTTPSPRPIRWAGERPKPPPTMRLA